MVEEVERLDVPTGDDITCSHQVAQSLSLGEGR